MCGRFTLTVDASELQEQFPWINIPNIEIVPRYNIAPTQPVAVIPNDGKNNLDFYIWGLIPSWSKDPTIGNRMINARSETLAEKPSFRNAFKRRRCLIPASGFYEWSLNKEKNQKTPYYILRKDNRVFSFAGLWEIWYDPDGSEIRSCTIITTQPNSLIRPLHNRMPVILDEANYEEWLAADEQNPDELSRLLTSYSPELMQVYPISKAVNNPKIDQAALIEPI